MPQANQRLDFRRKPAKSFLFWRIGLAPVCILGLSIAAFMPSVRNNAGLLPERVVSGVLLAAITVGVLTHIWRNR